MTICSCTVSGLKILAAQYTHPAFLSIMVPSFIIALLIVKLAPRFIRGWKRWMGRVALIVVALSPLIVIATGVSLIRPDVGYGMVIDDGKVTISYLGLDKDTLNVCTIVRVKLLDYNEAVSMLKVRDFGVGDPFTKTLMGYFTGVNETKFKVVIALGSRKVVYIETINDRYLVGVESIEKCYKALLEELKRCRR